MISRVIYTKIQNKSCKFWYKTGNLTSRGAIDMIFQYQIYWPVALMVYQEKIINMYKDYNID